MIELMERALVAESEDRPAWLAARACGITATEIKHLMMDGPGATGALIRQKIENDFPDLAGVPRIAWGRAREKYISAWIEETFSIAPSSLLFYAAANVRHLATPDGVGEDFDGLLINSEIKTSKYDLDPEDPTSYFWAAGYYYQVQWALYVTGAKRCLFAWEQHDDDFSGWPHVGPAIVMGEPAYRWIERDEVLISEMIDRAQAFLVALDEATTATANPTDPQLVLLSAELLSARKSEAEAKARKESAWTRIQKRLGDREGFSAQAGAATVTWSPGRVEESVVPDPEAAAAAHPLVFAAVRRADALWAHVVSKYTRTAARSVASRLTVTEVKKR